MNKVILLIAAVCSVGSIAVNAETRVYKEIYYGTRATGSSENPCQGETTRVCCEKWVQYDDGEYVGKVVIDETILDKDGLLISQGVRTEIGDLETLISRNIWNAQNNKPVCSNRKNRPGVLLRQDCGICQAYQIRHQRQQLGNHIAPPDGKDWLDTVLLRQARD